MKSPFTQGWIVLLLVSLCYGLASLPAYGLEEQRLRTFLKGDDYWNVRPRISTPARSATATEGHCRVLSSVRPFLYVDLDYSRPVS